MKVIGTSGSHDYLLHDETGSHRFWPVKVNGTLGYVTPPLFACLPCQLEITGLVNDRCVCPYCTGPLVDLRAEIASLASQYDGAAWIVRFP